jgi:hypothetical protein
MHRSCFLVVLVTVAACGGSSGGGGQQPTPTTTSIAVTLQPTVRMAQTTPATATALLSNGQSQSLTTGWLSDQPAVATVTTSGTVTGVANGRATIYIVSDGRQGQQVIRVVPDYQGAWQGGLRMTSCENSGAWKAADTCKGAVGTTGGWSLSLQQSGESMQARVDYGGGIAFPQVDASIAGDGRTSFTARYAGTQDDVSFTVDTTVNLNSTKSGELTGTLTEVWRLPNVAGEQRDTAELFQMNRTSFTAQSESPLGIPWMFDVLRRLQP